jgi:hypothetical protein
MPLSSYSHLLSPSPSTLFPPSKPTTRRRYAHCLKPPSDSSQGRCQTHSTLPCRAPIFVNRSIPSWAVPPVSPFRRYSFRMPTLLFSLVSFIYPTVRRATRLTSSATNGDPYSTPTSADITDEFHAVSTSRTYFPSSTLKCYYTFLSFSGSRMWIIDVYIRPSKRGRAEQRSIVRTPHTLFSLFLRVTLKVLACASCLFLSPV